MTMNDMNERVILVDDRDVAQGTEEKLAAHREGLLHRAFSIYVFDATGRLLLQRRAPTKYHSGGLWANTCCGHPREGENTLEAAHRRLREEMGFDCDLVEIPSTIYRADLDKDMIEHEFLHVFFGTYEQDPVPDPAEADSFRWMTLPELEADIARGPAAYTEWLKICLPHIVAHRAA